MSGAIFVRRRGRKMDQCMLLILNAEFKGDCTVKLITTMQAFANNY